MKKKEPPRYAYAIETPDGLMSVGGSTSPDCKTIIEVHPSGWPTLPDHTPVLRVPEYDELPGENKR
jgi:hypothetical protein